MEEELSYYQRNKERLKQQGREYHYKHREKNLEYSRNYYKTHKEKIMQQRATKYQKKLPKSRDRAHLDKPNPSDELETRRKSYQDICLTPPPPVAQPRVIVHTPDDFTVRFD